MAYRSTPNITTGKSPAELLYGRNIGTKLPDIGEMGEIDERSVQQQQVKDRDAEQKQIAADYANKKRQAIDRELETGDLVLLEKKKDNKLSPSYEKAPYKVTARCGDQIHIESPQGVEYKRNIQHLKRFNKPSKEKRQTVSNPTTAEEKEAAPTESLLKEDSVNSNPKEIPTSRENGEDTMIKRSGRKKKTPERLQDFVLT